MVFNTTSAEIINKIDYAGASTSMIKQICFGCIGLLISYVVYKIGYRNIIHYSPYLFLFLNILLIFVYVPHIGMKVNGARRWINLFGLSIQPSEFMKFILPCYYLNIFSKRDGKFNLKNFYISQIPMMIPIFLIIIEPDNGSAAVLLATLVIVYFLTRIRATYWFTPMVAVALIGGSIALNMQYVKDRIHIYLHPEEDLLGKGHQPYQSKIAVGSGGMFGRGLGESLQKLNYLPEARNDYIAAVYAEELGFLGILFLIILYMVVVSLGFKIACAARDLQGHYLATIYTFIIALQAFLNLGVVCGLLPSKGSNLPFFSQGGSSLLANIFMVSMILNINIERKTDRDNLCQNVLQ